MDNPLPYDIDALYPSPILRALQEPVPAAESSFDSGKRSEASITILPGQSIQNAIDTIAKAGGGEVRLIAGIYNLSNTITVPAKVALIGQGMTATILDFQGSDGRISTTASNVTVSDLQVKNSANSTSAVSFGTGSFYGTIRNVYVIDASNDGIVFSNASRFLIEGSIVESCGGDGVVVRAVGNLSSDFTDSSAKNFRLSGVSSINNSGNGFLFEAIDVGSMRSFTVEACDAQNNTDAGFRLDDGGDGILGASFSGCLSANNGDDGFMISSNDTSFVACASNSNTGYGYLILQSRNRLMGCTAVSNTIDGYHLGDFAFDTFIIEPGDATLTNIEISAANVVAYANLEKNRRVLKMKNTSGGTLTAGSVVVMKSSAPSTEFTTTTTAADKMVLGSLIESVSNNDFGPVLSLGKTTTLKVNGATDIAVGDLLTTYTVAGVAAKASAGQLAFAIAMEAYTANDSSGVIDALLITPRSA